MGLRSKDKGVAEMILGFFPFSKHWLYANLDLLENVFSFRQLFLSLNELILIVGKSTLQVINLLLFDLRDFLSDFIILLSGLDFKLLLLSLKLSAHLCLKQLHCPIVFLSLLIKVC